ncbi:hypothetical protein BCR42DRAFT_481239 [Absidia repens]|uniref:Response regulatory domain-containing protein n=1 Tax=Absidia repens TaxID=90262 RepID=A0A1X2IT06_9FUNG|nr:hypothetical protein BCR42DRAFT_481239 [Absidia repens]
MSEPQQRYNDDGISSTGKPRTSIDHLLSHSSSLYSASSASKPTLTSLRSTTSGLSDSDFDDSISSLALRLSFPHSKYDNTVSKETRIMLAFASCVCCVYCIHLSWLALALYWMVMVIRSFLIPTGQARRHSHIGQCGVVVSAGIILSSSSTLSLSSFLEYLSTIGSINVIRSVPTSLAPLWPATLTVIDTTEGTMPSSWSWSHGVLWICCMGLFHIAQRLCDIQNHEDLMIQQQQNDAQQQVDQYLGRMTGIRERFLDTLAREIQESTMMVKITLEQFSPITILNNTHELLSPCSMAVPVTNISAIHTTINEVGHIGSHLHLVSRLLRQDSTHVSPVYCDFDISELIQTVGDALSALASKLDVSVILYHMDNGLHCINVLGDENAIKHSIMSLVRNIMEGCTPGACIEIGLNAETHGLDRLQITFDITQTRSHAIPHGVPGTDSSLSIYTTELVRYSGGTLSVDKISDASTRYLVLYNMQTGSDNAKRRLIMERSIHDLHNNIQYASEPTLMELIDFVGKLKGMRMILYATEKSTFAKHLTSTLASWNADISHIPTTATALSATPTTLFNLPPNSPLLPGNLSSGASSSSSSNTTNVSTTTSHKAPTPATEEDHIHAIPPAFLLIDNDLPTLERQLQEYRTQQQYHHQQRQLQQQQNTPTMSTTYMPLPSTQQDTTAKRHRRHHQKTVAIIYFSYLEDARRVHELMSQNSSSNLHAPRVFIVPKPCGPRRFLTALHTAWLDAIVDPQFSPLATSPLNCPPWHATPNSIHTPPTPSADSKRISPAPRGDEGNYFAPRHASNSVSSVNPSSKSSPSSASAGSARIPSINRRLRSHSSTFQPPTNNNNARRKVDLSFTSPASDHHQDIAASSLQSIHQSPSPQINDEDPTTTSPLRLSIGSPLSLTNIAAIETNIAQQALVDHSQRQASNNAFETHESTSLATHETIADEQEQQEPQQQQKPQQDDPAILLENTVNLTSPSLPAAGQSAIEHSNATTLSAASALPVAASTSPDTTSSTSVPKRNLKFKISNRKKKDKNKHTPWWSPPIKVLIVEDNMINQAILSTWMKKHNIKYEVASDGKQAVEKWKKGGFHLILMDIQLPVMSGIDATKMIREIEKEENIGVLPSKWDDSEYSTKDDATDNALSLSLGIPPISSPEGIVGDKKRLNLQRSSTTATTFQSPVIIVALTASSHESDRQTALAAGCNDFLTKPVSLEWLEKKIMEWGCMQALIDVEGWREWKRSTSSASTVSAASSSLANSSAMAKSSSLDKTLALLKSTQRTPSSTLQKSEYQNQQTLDSDTNTNTGSLSTLAQHKDGLAVASSSSSSSPSSSPFSSPPSLLHKTHGILLQGSSTLVNKRMTTKSRLVLREPVS